jgi:hypothetical protein
MNWWQTLLAGVVPVLVTLVITNLAESKRRQQDANERQKDREAAEQARDAARRDSIEDHWRNERLARMTALVDLIGRMEGAATAAKLAIKIGGEHHGNLQTAMAETALKHADDLRQLVEVQLPEAVTQVSVIASQRFYEFARRNADAITEGHEPFRQAVSRTIGAQPDFASAQDMTHKFADRLTFIKDALVNKVREELTGDLLTQR